MNHDRRNDACSSVFDYSQLHSPNSNLNFLNGCRGNVVDVQVPNRPQWQYENDQSVNTGSPTTAVNWSNMWANIWAAKAGKILNGSAQNTTGSGSIGKVIARPNTSPSGGSSLQNTIDGQTLNPIGSPAQKSINHPAENPIGSPIHGRMRGIKSNCNQSPMNLAFDNSIIPSVSSNSVTSNRQNGSPLTPTIDNQMYHRVSGSTQNSADSPTNHYFRGSKNQPIGSHRRTQNGNQRNCHNNNHRNYQNESYRNYQNDSYRNYRNDNQRYCHGESQRNYRNNDTQRNYRDNGQTSYSVDSQSNYSASSLKNNPNDSPSNNPICSALTTISQAFAQALVDQQPDDNVATVNTSTSSSVNSSGNFTANLARNLANTLTRNWSKNWSTNNKNNTNKNYTSNWPSSPGSSGRNSANSSTGSSGPGLVKSPNGSSAESLTGISGSNGDRNQQRNDVKSVFKTSGRNVGRGTSNHNVDRQGGYYASNNSNSEMINYCMSPASYSITGTTAYSNGHSSGYSSAYSGSGCYSGSYSASRSDGSSSSSSLTSYSYGQSDDGFRMENLLYHLVKRVNDEVFGYAWANGHNPFFAAFANNTLLDLFNLNASLTTPSSPLLPGTIYCAGHGDREKFYCQTCSFTFCCECEAYTHQGHVMVRLIEALDFAGMEAHQVLNEAKIAICALREDLDAVQNAADVLDQKARQASTDIMICLRRVASALESREKELLTKVEKAKLLRFAALRARDQGLRAGIIRLSRAVDKLGKAIERTTITNHPLDLLITKDMVSAEIFKIQHIRQSLPLPAEENWISLSGSEAHVLQSLANFGSFAVNNPGPIGDRRALRGSIGQPSPFVYQPPSLVRPLISCGRPVPMVPYLVTARVLENTHSISETSKIIGCVEDGESELCRPWGVTSDEEGHIIIADRSNNRILIYHKEGTLIRAFGSQGVNFGEFDRPAGVAVDARKRIIVADKDNHRIQLFTITGEFMLCFGEKGNDCGHFNYPWDVAANSACQIVVSDTRNHRVQLFSAEGIFLRKYGFETSPSMWKHFDSPRGVTFNTNGDVVTTDFNNHRIVVINSDFMSARILGSEATSSTRQFLRPQGIVIDDDGNIIVADSRNHRIQIFDADGTLKWTFGSFGKGPNEMDRPSGIALCPDGKLAIVDFGNNRVLLV